MQNILLVEDDSTLAMGIEYSLKNEGYKVNLASNVVLGKQLIDKDNYDLIILDIMMPRLDGLTVCSEIRKESNRKV